MAQQIDDDSPEYEAKVRLAEQASEELLIRAGRIEMPDDRRPLRETSDEELEELSTWDPEVGVIEHLPGGIVLRQPKRRSSAKRRLKGEPEPQSIDDALERDRAPKEPESAPKQRAPRRVARPPRLSHARKPLGSALGQGVSLLGVGLQMSGRDVPVGRALMFEGPVAGDKLDAILAGTFIDRMLQPLARAGGSAKDLGSILALPIIVGVIERRPNLWPMLQGVLASLVTDLAIELAKSEQAAEMRIHEAAKVDPKIQQRAEELMQAILESMAPPDGTQPPAPPAG